MPFFVNYFLTIGKAQWYLELDDLFGTFFGYLQPLERKKQSSWDLKKSLNQSSHMGTQVWHYFKTILSHLLSCWMFHLLEFNQWESIFTMFSCKDWWYFRLLLYFIFLGHSHKFIPTLSSFSLEIKSSLLTAPSQVKFLKMSYTEAILHPSQMNLLKDPADSHLSRD